MSIFGALIIGGAGLLGGVLASKASKTASNAAQQSATENNALQREIYQQNTGNISPWMQRGNQAGTARNALLGLGGDMPGAVAGYNNFLANSDYGFQQDQARRGVTSSFAGRGLGQSGAALKALDDRRGNINRGFIGEYLDRLGGIDQTGLSGANALAGVGSAYAGAVGANNNSAADARGNAALASAGQTNALLGSLGQAGGYMAGQGAFGSSYKPSTAAVNTGWQSAPNMLGGW